jgi:hypothetical protein
MFIIAAILFITPLESPTLTQPVFEAELGYTKKKRKASSAGAGRKFSSCKAARKAGYTGRTQFQRDDGNCQKRDERTGHFMQVKDDGKPFKGVAK